MGTLRFTDNTNDASPDVADIVAGTDVSLGEDRKYTFQTIADKVASIIGIATGIANGLMSSSDKTKLDGIETGATADQSDAEIKTAYENNANTNAFTDAEQTLLGNQSGTNTGDEASATTSVEGIVELATSAEVTTGTDTTRAITPDALTNSAPTFDGSSLTYSVRSLATTGVFSSTDYTIKCTSGTFTVTLPTAVGITGRVYVLKNSGVGTITLDGNGTETIDGSLTVTANADDSYTVQSDGSNWIII